MRPGRPGRGLEWHFDHNDGRMSYKWRHYFEIYERYLARYRGRRITLLEIGVCHGGSLQLWRRYLGRRAQIVGLDIDPRVAALAEPGIDLVVGDQSDPSVIARLVDRYGCFDVVIDDGSHLPDHQIASMSLLWPYLSAGGTYIVEDLHTNYWRSYGAGRGHPGSFISWLGERIDDVHAFHSDDPDFVVNDWTRTIGAIHVHDSVVVLEKTLREPPRPCRSGRAVFDDVGGQPMSELMDDEYRAQLDSLTRPAARLRRFRRDPVGTVRRRIDHELRRRRVGP